jgi:hypothetical protein
VSARDIERLGAEFPAALLPLRLETRFVKHGSRLELLIRAYPDQVHQDSHEPGLTDAEVQWGEHFWEQRWRAGEDGAQQAEAWAQLAARFGAPRAAWVARQLRPQNMADAPTAPVDAQQPLQPAPQFPSPAGRESSWTRAPLARLLPAQLVAVGYRGGLRLFEEWGAPIPAQLATGPSPDHPLVTLPSGLRVDAAMHWMVDFEAAVKVGMGIGVAKTQGLQHGVDELYVLGLRTADLPDKVPQELAQLLEAHQYTDGFELLGAATPTNNGVDERTGYVARAMPAPDRWLREDPEAGAIPAGSDGAALLGALSLPTRSLVDVAGAGEHEGTRAAQMLSVLWPGLGGYALEQLVGGALSQQQLRGIADHVVSFVRPGGPLPALRVGAQPYGVLPVAAPHSLLPPNASADRHRAVEVMLALRTFWERSLDEVPKLGAGADPDADLLRVMGMDARSFEYAGRPFTGPQYVDDLIALLDGAGQAQRHADVAGRRHALAQLVAQIGITGAARAAQGFYTTTSALLRAPLVQQTPRSLTDEVDPEYLKWLLGAAWTDVLAGHDAASQPFGDTRKPLLFLLARAALLNELAGAAFDLLAAEHPPAVAVADHLDPEFVDATVKTPLWRLRQGLHGHPHPTLGELLWPNPDPATGAAGLRARAYRERLAALSKLPSATIDRLARDTIDIHAHRLDAWLTSLATRRLSELRQAQPAGVHVGAYGWLVDLKPGATPDTPTHPIREPAGEAGYVHAPSIAHAATAAILRGGQLAHAGQGTGKLLAVDLSSKRVREVDAVLDALRRGQSLGAVLGYRFERALHDSTDSGGARLDGYIQAFRALFPQTAGKLLPAAASGNGAAPGIVDGMALVRRHQHGPDLPWGQDGLPPASGADHDATVAALDGLVEIADALSDATIAESLYHAVQGNPLRSGASLDAIDRGEAPPPQLEFTHPPRSGVAITHRVGVLRNAAGADPTGGVEGWAADAPRGEAEPVLSAVCAALLPAPAAVRWQARYDALNPAAETSFWQGFSLADLDIGPLDAVYGAVAGGDPAASELEARAGDAARAAHPGYSGDITLVGARDPNWGADVFTLTDLGELAAALRTLLTSARALTPVDLLGAGATAPALDAQALSDQRVTPAISGLNGVLSALEQAATGSDADALRDALLAVSGYGIGSAVPASVDLAALEDQAARVLGEGQARAQAAGDAFANATPDQPGATTKLVDALRAVFGSGFAVAPPFAAPAGVDFSSSAALLDGGGLTPEDWVARAARVREGVDRLAGALLAGACSEPLAQRGAAGDFAITQVPAPAAGERWVGLPSAPGGPPPPGGRVSLVFEGAAAVDLTGPIAGLIVDDFVEVVPAEHETTAVAFSYDAPASCAPQAILLAMAPAQAKTWSLAALEDVAREALSLSRMRTVDPDALQGVGHLIPSLFLADNDLQETISTDLYAETSR